MICIIHLPMPASGLYAKIDCFFLISLMSYPDIPCFF